jgi:hypothetical protein
MPELSVLMEMEKPELWIPIPGLHGVSDFCTFNLDRRYRSTNTLQGFLLRLEGQSLHVTLYHTVLGKVKSQKQEFMIATDLGAR